MNANLQVLRKVAPSVPAASLHRLFGDTLYSDKEPADAAILVAALANWLYEWRLFGDLGIYDVVKKLEPAVCQLAEDLAVDDDSAPSILILTVHDGRWTACTGWQQFFDVQTGKEVEELPGPAVSHLSCDITALYWRTIPALHR